MATRTIGLLRTIFGVGLPISADRGDTAQTLTVGTDSPTQLWNTILTADRAVTLSTTGAMNGDRFFVVRGLSATGAFNLNVGSGPLLALSAAGQYVLVGYNGAAWQVLDAGFLSLSGTATTQAANDNSTKIATTAYVDRAPGNASTTSATPTNTTSTSLVHMAVGGTLTPTRSPRALLCLSGQGSNSGANSITVQLRYGTGTAPVNGAAATGTAVGAAQILGGVTADERSGFAWAVPVSGLSIGTAYWIDVAVKANIAGTASVFDITVAGVELP